MIKTGAPCAPASRKLVSVRIEARRAAVERRRTAAIAYAAALEVLG